MMGDPNTMKHGFGVTKLERQLIRHEGKRNKVYFDSEGVMTIGIGHNLDEHGLTDDQVMIIFKADLRRIAVELLDAFEVVHDLDDVRAETLLNMAFNLGIPRLKTFKRMWAAIEKEDYNEAAVEMLDSKWAKQVGDRAVELAAQMRHGRYAD